MYYTISIPYNIYYIYTIYTPNMPYIQPMYTSTQPICEGGDCLGEAGAAAVAGGAGGRRPNRCS